MKRISVLAGLFALGVVGVPATAQTTGGSPASATALPTPLTTIRAGAPMRMEYTLKASAWAFILPISGKASFTVDMKPDTYAIQSKVKTTGLADILVNYDLGLSASGYVRPQQLKTWAFTSQNRDGKKNRRVEMTYGAQDVAMTATPAFGNLGDPAATPPQKLEALDPITALINFSLAPRTSANLCGGPIKIFDGRQLSHLNLEYVGMKRVKSDAWRGEAVECNVTLDRVAGYKKGQADNDNLTGINGDLKMWLAPMDNGAYVPVRIEADTDKIGKVTLQASRLKFTPLAE